MRGKLVDKRFPKEDLQRVEATPDLGISGQTSTENILQCSRRCL